MTEQTFDVVALHDIIFTKASPMARNKKGALIQSPSFTIKEGGESYYFAGRDVMWSYLDALFPGDSLPRNAVEDDIFAPTLDSPSLFTLLVDLSQEAAEDGNDYLVFYHIDNKVQMVKSLADFSISNDIEVAGNALSAAFYATATYRPFKFRNRTGVHLRPSTHVNLPYYTVHIVDLGKRWYFITLSDTSMDGEPIALHQPITIDKEQSMLDTLSQIKNETRKFVQYVGGDEGALPKIIRTPANESSFRSNEYHELLYLRWVKPGVRL